MCKLNDKRKKKIKRKKIRTSKLRNLIRKINNEKKKLTQNCFKIGNCRTKFNNNTPRFLWWLCPGGGGGGGGHSTFFQVGVCGPDFRSVGLANWHLPLKRGACERKISKFGGLWAENFQIWGLVSWKFPNLGACELKISKFGGLWAKIWVTIEAVEAKISKFSKKGVMWTDCFAWNGTLASGRRGVKRGSSGPHIPIPPL